MANVKGYVWYSPASSRSGASRSRPRGTSCIDLTKTIQEKTGQPPWCAGFDSDAATGWPGTDWIEDLVLRQSGPEVYDQWVDERGAVHRPRRSSRRSTQFGEILLDPDVRQRRIRRRQVDQLDDAFGDLARRPSPTALRAAPPGVVPIDGFITRPLTAATVGRGRRRLGVPPAGIRRRGRRRRRDRWWRDRRRVLDDAEPRRRCRSTCRAPSGRTPRVARWRHLRQQGRSTPRTRRASILQEAIEHPAGPTRRRSASTRRTSCRRVVGSGSFWKGMVDWINGTRHRHGPHADRSRAGRRASTIAAE